MRKLTRVSLFFLLLVGHVAYAQTWEGCIASGVPVPTIRDATAPGPAFGGQGRIIINPVQMLAFSPSHQKFIYWHECGHVVLGHRGSSPQNEMDADCIAFRFLTSTYNLSVAEIVQIAREMSQMAGDWSHLPGPARVQHLLTCGGEPHCRTLQVPEQYSDFELRSQAVRVPCVHCGCNAWGVCGCMDPFDIVQQAVSVPVVRTRMVTRQVCD